MTKYVDLKVIDDAGINLILVDHNLSVTYVSKALCKVLGKTGKDCAAQHVSQLLNLMNAKALEKKIDRCLEGKVRRSVTEACFVDGIGREVPVLASVFRYKETPQGPLSAAIQLTDIAALKHAELKLAVSEERSKFALESNLQGVWDRNVVTGEDYHSDRWYQMRGLHPEAAEKAKANWKNRLHPADFEKAMQVSASRRLGEIEDGTLEYRERHADGHWIWILSRGRVIEWGKDQRPIRIIGTDTDITEVKETEIALEKLTSRLELALATSLVGVWEVDLETGIGTWDDVMKDVYCLSDLDTENVPPDTWENALHPEDAPDAIKTMSSAIVDRSSAVYNFRIILPDGRIRYIEAVARFHQAKDGRPRYLGTNRDVTRDVVAAQELSTAKRLAEEKNLQLETARSQMEFDALHDALTGLPNRRFLDENLALLSEKEQPLALLEVDVDRFKQINDTMGHAAGDAVLKHCADVLRGSVDDNGFVARAGGDEFVICNVNATSRIDLEALAKRILLQLSEPLMYNNRECRFGVSIGIAYSSQGSANAKSLLVDADMALYGAKNNGRNCFQFFTPKMHSETVRTKRIADEILAGLEGNHFVTYYQPQFNADSFEISGVEALVRWQHPTEGLLEPSAFLEVAYGLSVISTIDRIVLEQALSDFKTWQAMGLNIPKVSVNVSSRRLRDESLVDHLSGLDFDPGTLSFELLESIFLDECDGKVMENINYIKSLGIEIDVDDFGTGHASIVGLLRIAPDRLKIDRQLISPITQSSQARLLAKSIIDIGHSLGIGVVAEGVETAQQAQVLRDHGCDYLQGFHFCRPMSSSDLISFAENAHRGQSLKRNTV